MPINTDRKFGRIPSPIDERDWSLEQFTPRKLKLEVDNKKIWDFPSDPLNQGNTGHCTGFSMAHFGICLPEFTEYTEEDAHQFYYECKKIDGDPLGEDGSTIRSVAKVLQDKGIINNYAFASDIDTIKWWLLNRGSLIMATIWTEGMMSPDEEGLIDIHGYVLGGHAYIVNGWDNETKRFKIVNSWGNKWGKEGMGFMTEKDFEAIFKYGGEALAAVELEKHKIKGGCWLINLIKKVLSKLFG